MIVGAAAILALLAVGLAAPTSFQTAAADNYQSSRSYPLEFSGFSLAGSTGCPPGHICPSVTVVNQSPKDIQGILYGNASGYGVSGLIVYTGSASVSVPAAQTVSSQLVFDPPGIEPGICELGFDFVVFATNGTQLSDPASFGPFSCDVVIGASLSEQNATCSKLGAFDAISITYKNKLSQDLFPLVVGVVVNSIGQIVDYPTANPGGLAINGTSTAYVAIFGLPQGDYLVAVYAILAEPGGETLISPTVMLNCEL